MRSRDGRAAAARDRRAAPRRVVNATGVTHTNLGRAVMARGAGEAALEAATRYGDLELDLATGRRGERLAPLGRKLALLAGCEAALAVNNNAAALLLAVATLARGREVIVSRGELVEIGGSFRLPEILEAAGVRLVEVGTTNGRTRDYRRACVPRPRCC
jgi:L-seryl-tRNA(Ser) seleniumtransferase